MTEEVPEVFGPDELYLIEETLRDTRGLEELYTSSSEGRLGVFRRARLDEGFIDAGVSITQGGEVRMTIGGQKGAQVVRTIEVEDLDCAIAQAQSHLLEYLDAVVSAR